MFRLLASSLVLLAVAVSAAASTYTVSVLPLRGIVMELAGPEAEVDCLVPPGQSPETFEPTSRQLARLARSSALFTIGLPFEEALAKRLRGQFPHLLQVDTAEGIDRIEIPAVAGGHEGHQHGDLDPHVWTGPVQLVRIAANVARALVVLEPDRAEAIAVRHAALERRLHEIDRGIAARLQPYSGRAILAYHPAYGYFTGHYGIRQLAVESGGTEPGARHLVELTQRVRDERLTCLFAQPQFSPDRARSLARTLGLELVVLDPLREDVTEMLLDFATAIEAAWGAAAGDTR